jgi:competence protein ComEA
MRGGGSLDATVRRALAALALVACAGAAPGQEINDATRAQLEQLNGIGVAMAERILIERNKAPFTGWEDLARRVKGMRGARIERLKAQGVTVAGVPGSRALPQERKP